MQNYPNPFNPSTKIRYRLSQESKIKIEIVDILGRIVEVVENKTKPAGYYEINWDAKNNSSGIYYAKLIAETNSGGIIEKTIKMVYLK